MPEVGRDFWGAILAAALLSGCAGANVEGLGDETVEVMPSDAGCIVRGKWVMPGRRTVLTTADVMGRVDSQPVMLLGEFHDSRPHHQWQLQMLGAALGRDSNLLIGLEMLPRSAQPVLDKWVAGEIDADTLIRESGWMEYWRFEPDLYMPIFEFARMNQIPLYALNVERGLMNRLRSEGWGSIPETARDGITNPAPASDDYLMMLASTFRMHGHRGGGTAGGNGKDPLAALRGDENFQRFVEGQQLWDRVMAQSIAQALEKHPGSRMVALMGSGHMMYRFGVPHQLDDLGLSGVTVLLPWQEAMGCEMLEPGIADLVFGIEESDPEETDKPKLGVHIEPGDGGVKISKVVAGSIAERAGLLAGDLIVEVAGRAAGSVQDVIDAVDGMQEGTWLPIVVVRQDQRADFVAKFPNASSASRVR